MSLPINFMGREFAEAELRIVEPPGKKPIPLHFNPAEYKRKKEISFAEIPIPGLDTPPLQYVRGGAEVLSMDLLVDTSDDPKGKGVREKYVMGIEQLLRRDEKLHAPPIVDFVWGEQVFHGVLQSLEVAYVLFHTDGKPLRAKLSVQLKEYRPVKDGSPQLTSPDVEKRYVVRAGETLSSISSAVFRDAAHWREIALANGIADPRAVAPGTVLTIPRLEAPIA